MWEGEKTIDQEGHVYEGYIRNGINVTGVDEEKSDTFLHFFRVFSELISWLLSTWCDFRLASLSSALRTVMLKLLRKDKGYNNFAYSTGTAASCSMYCCSSPCSTSVCDWRQRCRLSCLFVRKSTPSPPFVAHCYCFAFFYTSSSVAISVKLWLKTLPTPTFSEHCRVRPVFLLRSILV